LKALCACLAVAGLGWAGCLPHGALGVPAEASSYALRLDGVSEEFRVHVQWARSFRDSSEGWLVCLHAPPLAAREGDPCVEMRSFATGEVLELRGASRWVGGPVHLESLALIWPLLSPAMRAEPDLVVSWPLMPIGRDWLRLRATGGWLRGEEPLARGWRARIVGASPADVAGILEADVRLRSEARLQSARWSYAPEGTSPALLGGELRYLGEAPALPTSACGRPDENLLRPALCVGYGTAIDDDAANTVPPNLFRGRPTLLQSAAEPAP
jgi:hypothetical protein